MNLVTLLREWIERAPSQTALEMRPRFRTLRWSYHDLGTAAASLSRLLESLEIGEKDNVLLLSYNSPFWVAAYFAILNRGAVVVPLNPKSTPEQFELIQNKVRAKCLLKSFRLQWSGPGLPVIDLESALERTPVPEETPHLSPPSGLNEESLAEIVFTSGTTGDPKGVMLTHGNLISNIRSLAEAIPFKAKSRLLNIVPLFHMYGQMTGMLYPLSRNSTIIYLPSLGSRLIRETLNQKKVHYMIAVPEFLKTVMNRLEQVLKEHHLSKFLTSPLLTFLPLFVRRGATILIRRKISKTLHTIASGGAPLDPAVEKKWRNLGFTVLQGYGLTETGPVVAMNTYRDHRLGSVGKPLPGVEVKLTPDNEIYVRGSNVTPGYYEDPDHTLEAFDNGWFKTNDGGAIDSKGFIEIHGRKKYMILSPSGENVFPEDIENQLNKNETVRDSAVIGLDLNGKCVIHAVLLGEDCDGDRVIERANAHLAPHQQIMEWSLWPQPDFPRSATRKVKKEEVLKWLKEKQKGKKPVPRTQSTPLTRLLGQVTETDPVHIEQSTRIVAELGLDSLSRIELVSRIEEEFDAAIEERDINPKTTVAELESVIAERKGKPLAVPRFSRWPQSLPARLTRPVLLHGYFFLIMSYYVKRRLKGLENLKGLKGPVLFMPNHRSYLDSMAIYRSLPLRFRKRFSIAAAMDVLYKHFDWFVFWAEWAFNSFPFATHEDENLRPSLDHAGYLIDHGWNVLVFPEGLINRTDKPLLPLKGGTGLLAVDMQVPVVPVVIRGSAELVPPGKTWPVKKGTVEIEFGKPLSFSPATPYPEATRQVEEALKALASSY